MASCHELQELLAAFLEGELDEETAHLVRDHLDGCPECAELIATLEMIQRAVSPLAELEPPVHMQDEIAASPCRRWLGLLHSAVDRDIDQPNLDRLLSHLESCPSCRQAWNDLTLIHQVSEAMVPPPHLLSLCLTAHRRVAVPPLLSRRVAVAAAYVLAVLASLMIGNPVSIARSPVVQKVTETVATEVNQVAEEGRGEIQVMIFRAWKWGTEKAANVRDLLRSKDESTKSGADQGD